MATQINSNWRTVASIELKQFTFGPESKSNIIYTFYVDYLHILKLKLHFILTHTAKCNCA